MREFQAKNRIRHILYSKMSVVVILIFLVLLGRATFSVYVRERESVANVVQASRELKRLQEREQLLTREIERLSTEEGIEEEIRSKYSVSKPGEHLIVIVDTGTATPTTTEPLQNKSWWGTVLKLFY